MKKLLIALCIFTACTAPVSEQVTKDASPVKTKSGDETAVVPVTPAPVTKLSTEQDVATIATRPTKNLPQVVEPAQTPIQSTPAEIKAEQRIADSIQNAQQGGGSDIEGYIPFIKQFYDR